MVTHYFITFLGVILILSGLFEVYLKREKPIKEVWWSTVFLILLGFTMIFAITLIQGINRLF